MTLDQQFDDAQSKVRTMASTPSNQVLLDLYGLYKQGSMGDVQGKRPGLLDLKGRAKFDAWATRRGMAREQAKQAYVSLVDRLLSGGGR